jgi:hypothetical protein
MSVGSNPSVGERHTAILNLRNSLSQAIKDMAADMETNTARVVLTGPWTAVVYIKAAFPSGDGTGSKTQLRDFLADVVDGSGVGTLVPVKGGPS